MVMAASDQQNPFLLQGLMGMMQPNPYIQPQWQNSPLSLPGFYGDPTDATGKPIQSFQDAKAQSAAAQAAAPPPGTTTLNSTGMYNAPTATNGMGSVNQSAFSTPGMGGGIDPSTGETFDQAQAALRNYYNPTQGSMVGGDTGGGTGGGYSHAPTPQYEGPSPQSMGVPAPWASQGSSAPAASSAPAGPDMRQAYLDARSNPGTPAMQGATVPQSAPLGQPSVMSAFLAAHPSGGGAGAGNYNNSRCFSIL